MTDSSSPAASDSWSDCRCNAGYAGPNGGTCTACSSGTYKSELGSGSCSSCPSGESCVRLHSMPSGYFLKVMLLM